MRDHPTEAVVYYRLASSLDQSGCRSSQMNILHIIPSLNPRAGGPVEGLTRMVAETSRQGHTVEVATFDGPDRTWQENLPVRIHALGPTRLNYGYSGNVIPWLRKHAPNYDAVIVEGLWQFHSYATWKALRGGPVPYFVFPHGMLDPWFKRKYPLKHLKKWLYWPWAEYQVLRDAAAVLFTCEEERLLARQSFWLYRAHEAVASYGTDAPPEGSERHKAAFLLKFPECRDQRLILHLGRIQEKKGCDVLIEAFARIASRDRSIRLVMAGPDQTGWIRQLVAQADRLGVGDRITWTGMLSGSLKWGALRACEVLGLPSHQENFGVVVVEALACGKPVLISNKVNIWREIEADGAGIVAEDDVEGTVRNLEAWLALDTTEYATMSQRAEACFHQRFHIQTAARQLLNIVTEYVR